MGNALKWINAEAKRLQRSHPGASWKNLTKQASAKYRATHKKSGTGKSRKKSGTGKRRARVGGNVFDVVPQIGAAKVGATIPQLEGAIRKKLVNEIARLEAQKFTAKKKTQKRKIARRIAAKKRDYRRFS